MVDHDDGPVRTSVTDSRARSARSSAGGAGPHGGTPRSGRFAPYAHPTAHHPAGRANGEGTPDQIRGASPPSRRPADPPPRRPAVARLQVASRALRVATRWTASALDPTLRRALALRYGSVALSARSDRHGVCPTYPSDSRGGALDAPSARSSPAPAPIGTPSE